MNTTDSRPRTRATVTVSASEAQDWTRLRDRALALAVRLTPARHRHALLDCMAQQIAASLRPVPRSGRCACGQRLLPSTRAPEVETYELDYSVGWQDQTASAEDGQVIVSCCTQSNDQQTLADLMCPACQRLYTLPTDAEKNYG